MAGKLTQIRASSPAAAITGAELIEVTQSGATKAATVAEILAAQSLDGLSDVTVTGAAHGAIIYRAEAGWVHLPAGAAGQVLTTSGAGANPAWATVADGDGGTVTSVALAVPTFLSVAGSPITGAGTLALSLADQGAGLVFAAPAGATGAPSFRPLVSTDLPGHSHPEAQRIPVNTQTGTAYALVVADAGACVRCNNAAAVAVTAPTGDVFAVGDVVLVRQVGAGQVTVTGGTLNLPAAITAAKTRAQGSVITLHYVAADTWDVSGDLA